jgi:hypothetical protein
VDVKKRTSSEIEHEFYTRTKPLECGDVNEAGIVPDHITGEFYEDRIDELKAFCAKWPFLHIISCNQYELYNRYVPGCEFYCLAQGDADPTIEAKLGPLTREDFELMLSNLLKIPEHKRDWVDRIGIAWATAVLNGADAFASGGMKKFYDEARAGEGDAELQEVELQVRSISQKSLPLKSDQSPNSEKLSSPQTLEKNLPRKNFNPV